jgi:hypothetical protein
LTVLEIATVVLTIVTGIGVIVSLVIGIVSVRAANEERRLSRVPRLAFEPGGNVIEVRFEKVGRSIPGMNPDAVARDFPWVRGDAESVRLVSDYGRLRNYGPGPGLEVQVIWVPQRVRIGTDSFVIDDEKRGEPIYSAVWNQLPTQPSHVLPGESAELTRLPTFIEKDVDKKFGEVEGELLIQSTDVFENLNVSRQEFGIYPEYGASPPVVIVTFGDLKRIAKDEGQARNWLRAVLETAVRVAMPFR